MSFFNELKRRNVIRVGSAYVVMAWLLIQVSETLLPLFDFEASTVRMVVVVLAIGFVPALVFAWAFELTPQGIRRDHEVDRSHSIAPQTGKKLDRLIMLLLALGLGYFAFDKFVLDPSRDTARELIISQQARSEALVERYGDKSIAVLPFVNMSSDPEQEYFSDGISEELLNLLAKIPELRVISRSSAFSFKGKDLDIPTIASQLQVAHVLEGSVRKAGNKVRITAQLIDARTDTHLWSQTYDRELDDIFAIQDEISGKVVEQLRLTLLKAAPQARKTDPEAFNLFLQGRFFLDQFTQESLEKASEFYQGALDIDPEYPPALKGLAEVYANRAAQGFLPLQESVETAWRLVRKSAELDPYYADAWAGIGSMYQYYEHDLDAAAHSFEKAVELGPNQGSIVGDAGVFAMLLGRHRLAMDLIKRQARLDPVSPVAHFQLGRTYLLLGHSEQAVAAFRTVLDLSPERITAWYWLAIALKLNGDPDAALIAIQNERYGLLRLTAQAMIYHVLGRSDESDTSVADLVDGYAADWPHFIASVYAVRDEPDLAFSWLEKAEQSNANLSALVVTSFFISLHDDPRWQGLLERQGYSEAQLAAIDFEISLPD